MEARETHRRSQQALITIFDTATRTHQAVPVIKTVVNLYTYIVTSEAYVRKTRDIKRIGSSTYEVYQGSRHTYDVVQAFEAGSFKKIRTVMLLTSIMVTSNLLNSIRQTYVVLHSVASTFTSTVRKFYGVWRHQDTTKTTESINYLYSGERPMENETTMTDTPSTTLYGDARDEQDLTAVGDSIKVTKNPDRIIRVHLSSTAGSEDRI
jgi:hypothetical protein